VFDSQISPVPPRGRYDLLAVIPALKALNLPHVRFDASILEFLNTLSH
jgi:hypothetical protein